ncbi:MAG: DNA primase DnaG [archaeon]
MAKTYLSTVKYEIRANYEVTGVIEKPDMIGAIFGQSEGLLGEDMDLKELQQNGKIGRIEITVNRGKGTTFGEIVLPSSLDQVKTSILAATVETVDKVGPFEAKVKVTKIMDTRKEKREVITDRAKELLKNMQKFEGVESSELADTVKTEIRSEKIIEFNGLSAGPEVEASPEIIIVEGRADVLKLLSYGINNAVAMNGANISPQMIDLCKLKNTTVLIDGDRGGELNVKKLSSLTKVDYVAVAPDGKEVEELAQKEILQALKRRHTLTEYLSDTKDHKQSFGQENTYAIRATPGFQPRFERPSFGDRREGGFNSSRGGFGEGRPQRSFGNDRQSFGDRPQFGGPRRDFNGGDRNFNHDRPFNGGMRDNRGFGGDSRGGPRFERPAFGDRPSFGERPQFGDRSRPFEQRSFTPSAGQAPAQNGFAPRENFSSTQASVPKEVLDMKAEFDKLKGKSKARLLDEKGKKIKDVEVKDLLTALDKNKKKIGSIMFDGIITKRLVEAAEKREIKTIIGVKKGTIDSSKVNTYTL